jgi:hypothetical protein
MKTTNPWLHLRNPFLYATENSYPKAMSLSEFHENALSKNKTDPFILALFNAFHPFHENYENSYGIWKAQVGVNQGGTLKLGQLLKQLSSTRIKNWDNQIQIKYPQNTPEYIKLLPNRRMPFQGGKQKERIDALGALTLNLSTDTSLNTLFEEVDDFNVKVIAAAGQKKTNRSTNKGIVNELETLRVAMCIAMYANLGGMIQKYAATPEKVEQYFDLALLRRPKQTLFTGHLKPAETFTIAKRTFGESDEITLTNHGPSQLKFYLAHTKNKQPGTTAITLDEGDQTVLASALGNLSDTYLTVLNTNSLLNGEFTVEVL